GAVGKSLRTVLERRDIRIEHGRAAKRWHVDEALRELSVAAEIHEARAAPQGRARFVGEFGHWRRASPERLFGPLPSMLRGPWQPIDFRPRRPTMPQSSWARAQSVRVIEELSCDRTLLGFLERCWALWLSFPPTRLRSTRSKRAAN